MDDENPWFFIAICTAESEAVVMEFLAPRLPLKSALTAID